MTPGSAWLATQRPTMRQVHRAGEKLFIDYSGKKPSIVDPDTGEVIDVELFVACLGASNLTYAEAIRTQCIEDWLASLMRALEYLGGVPEMLVPDQLKTGVPGACFYEPTIQRSYVELAEHYGTVVVPARPHKPRDKAKVDVGVQVVQRWILARLRNETLTSAAAAPARPLARREHGSEDGVGLGACHRRLGTRLPDADVEEAQLWHRGAGAILSLARLAEG